MNNKNTITHDLTHHDTTSLDTLRSVSTTSNNSYRQNTDKKKHKTSISEYDKIPEFIIGPNLLSI